MGKHIEPGTRLFVAEGRAILIGGILDTKVHAHHAIQLTLGPYGEFGAELEGTEFSTSSLLVDSDFPHRISGGAGRQLLALFEPESRRGALLRRALDGSPFASAGLRAEGEAALKLLCEDGSLGLAELASGVFSALGLREDPPAELDPRVTATISIIDGAHERRIGPAALARGVGLSEGRLQHLFKAGTGISIKKYLLWKRLIDGILALLEKSDITAAAMDSGFFDSAHFSRAFSETFGLSPAEIFKDSGSVQVRSDRRR